VEEIFSRHVVVLDEKSAEFFQAQTKVCPAVWLRNMSVEEGTLCLFQSGCTGLSIFT
jgi:hypothetical protein